MNTPVFFQFNSPNGLIKGTKITVESSDLLVVLAAGHNGFYHYGMFPTLQESFAINGISSVAFNYSHCGISYDGSTFEDLERYEKNCRRLEKEDICSVVEWIHADESFRKSLKICLLAHSMGGISAAFATHYLQSKDHLINGLILLCSMKTLNVRSLEIMKEWNEKGVYWRLNPRTNQMLPQGAEFLAETLASESTWNMERICKELETPVFVAHSQQDEAVPFDHGESIYRWLKSNHPLNEFYPISNAGHTLNTVHPTNRNSDELQLFIEKAVDWLKTI